MSPLAIRLSAAAFAAAALAAPLHAQSSLPRSGPWFVEGGLGIVSPVDQPAANVDVGGPGPLTSVRFGRAVRPRLALTASASYGAVADARREEYRRPDGAVRIDRYDYGMVVLATGVEYEWPMRRLRGLVGVEAGAMWERRGLVEHTDPTPVGTPPSSSTGVAPVAALRLGARYPLADRVALGGLVHVMGGAGTIENGNRMVLPQLVLRWSF